MRRTRSRKLFVLLVVLIGIACTTIADGRPGPAVEKIPGVNRDRLLGHLNAAITWYRDSTNKIQGVGLPSDAIYEDNTRSLAMEAVRLALESARAAAPLAEPRIENAKPSPAGGHQDFSQIASRISGEIDDLQSRIDDVGKQIARAPRSKRAALISQQEKLRGELALDKTVQDAVQKMAAFAESNNEAGEGLEGSINQLARSVPEILAAKTQTQQPGKPGAASTAAANAAANKPTLANSSGLIGQSIALLDRVRAMHDIDQIIKETDRLRENADNLRKPMREALAGITKRGRDFANEPDVANTPATSGKGGASKPDANSSSAEIRREYDELAAQFKQISVATLPLSQEILLIEQSRVNFIEWRRSIVRDSTELLRNLLIRVIGIALALGIVGILSEVWRRLTFRYIHEPRRRRQFLLLRRFVMGFLVGVVLIVGFVSEFSSLATFAGFVTAGIAVGLQAVLLSVAAYFFVVGRYGIRVGDRISIAGVTGDVIDIGLVRLYIMELAGTGIDLYPTGRVVVFSNSVLFQAGTPLFKQIPGTEYAWHELAVPLTPTTNYKLVQEKVFAAVTAVYEKYRERLESGLGNIDRQSELRWRTPTPEATLQLADTGLELVVRYPVELHRAAEIDDEVTRAVIDATNAADVKSALSSPPKIRAAIKG